MGRTIIVTGGAGFIGSPPATVSRRYNGVWVMAEKQV